MQAKPKSKILPLESLRGIAALTVALHHFRPNSILTSNPFVAYGYSLVDFFFVLSGFVMMYTYHSRINNFKQLVDFQKKRFWRLYPLHLTMLLVFVGIQLIKYFAISSGMSANNPAFTKDSLAAFLHNLFLTHAIFYDGVSYNYPSWSISVEFYTYLIFGGVILIAAKRTWLFSLIISLASVVILFAADIPHPITRVAIFRCTYAFFLGVLCYELYARREYTVPGFLVVLTGILIIALTCLNPSARVALVFPPIYAVFLLLVLFAPKDGTVVKVLSLKPLVWLGTLSYSIYMTHAAVWWFTGNTLVKVFKVNHRYDAGSKLELLLPQWQLLLITLFGMLVTLVLSSFTYKFIEDRFRSKRKTAKPS